MFVLHIISPKIAAGLKRIYPLIRTDSFPPKRNLELQMEFFLWSEATVKASRFGISGILRGWNRKLKSAQKGRYLVRIHSSRGKDLLVPFFFVFDAESLYDIGHQRRFQSSLLSFFYRFVYFSVFCFFAFFSVYQFESSPTILKSQ